MSSPQLTLLYDGSCPICRWEQRNLAAVDQKGRLAFVDIQDPEFDPAYYGATLKQLMGRLHGIRADGRVLVGLDTLIAAYRAVGWWWLSVPLSCLPNSVGNILYDGFAARRYIIARRFGHWFDDDCPKGHCQRPRSTLND